MINKEHNEIVWKEYVECNENKLSKDAIEFRKWLITEFKNKEHFIETGDSNYVWYSKEKT